MTDFKFIYTVVKELSTFDSGVMTLDQIDRGMAKTFLEMNMCYGSHATIHRWLFTDRLDIHGNEIYVGHIVKFYTFNYPHKESGVARFNRRKGYDFEGIQDAVVYEDGAILPFNDGTYTEDEQGDHFQSEYGFEIVGDIYRTPELITRYQY